jgi:hypothetical protein
VVGRDERRIEKMALPAHVVSNPSHAGMFSMARATGIRGCESKDDAEKARKTGGCPGI